MASDDLSDLRARVERLEREFERLRRRGEPPPQRIELGPPPVLIPPDPMKGSYAWSPDPPRRTDLPRAGATIAPGAAAKGPASVDAEYKFGSTVLPRAGMVLLLLGILILVAIAIQRGFITLQVQFAGEIALCVGLIAFGLWKLNEREDFGQVMVGGGSCGLYFSFAGAHVFKDLIPGETLVSLFLALSLANLAFSWWRSSKTFWMIGFVGGLVAAGLPLDKHDTTAALVLAGSIMVPATVLAGYRRWFKALAGLWLVATLFTLLTVHEAVERATMDVATAIIVLCAFSLVPIAAHVWRFVANVFDPEGWFGISATGLTALAVLTFNQPITFVPHSVAVIVWSVTVAAVAWPIANKVQGRTLLFAAFASATFIGPTGLSSYHACLTYIGLALATSALAHYGPKPLARAAVLFSASHVVFAIVAYSIAMSAGTVPVSHELTMLVVMAVGLANVTYLAGRLQGQMGNAVAIGAVLLYPLVARSAYVGFEANAAFSVIFGTAAYALILAVVSLRARWTNLARIGVALSTLATFVAWANIYDIEPTLTIGRQVVVLILTAVSLTVSALGSGTSEGERTATWVVAAVPGWFIVSRLIVIALGLPSFELDTQSAMQISWFSYAILLAVAAKRSGLLPLAWLGSGVTVVATVAYWSYLYGSNHPAPLPHQLVVMLVGSVALVSCALTVTKDDAGREGAHVSAGVVGWFVVARLFYVLLAMTGMQAGAALTTSWSVYAASLLALGFAVKERGVRILSLGIFAVTIAKVFIVDLAELDDLIKVVVLVVLGSLLIAGGYIYLRARQASTSD